VCARARGGREHPCAGTRPIKMEGNRGSASTQAEEGWEGGCNEQRWAAAGPCWPLRMREGALVVGGGRGGAHARCVRRGHASTHSLDHVPPPGGRAHACAGMRPWDGREQRRRSVSMPGQGGDGALRLQRIACFHPQLAKTARLRAWRGEHGWPLGLGPWVGRASRVDTQPGTRLPATSLTRRGVPLVAANPPTQHAAMLVGLVDSAPPRPAPAHVALRLVGLLKAQHCGCLRPQPLPAPQLPCV